MFWSKSWHITGIREEKPRSPQRSSESTQKRKTNPGLRGKLGRSAGKAKNGAVERTRTFTVLLPPAPQAGASANSATTALRLTFEAASANRLRHRLPLYI
jgi:glycerol-3-phosphate dehydrogenase